jgi:uncharacterized protein YjhX (UPF0386 family)
MIPQVEDCYFYSRENNTIIANLTHGGKIPLVRLHQNFINITVMDGKAWNYMQKYMAMFPHLWEQIKEEKKENEQLTLF